METYYSVGERVRLDHYVALDQYDSPPVPVGAVGTVASLAHRGQYLLVRWDGHEDEEPGGYFMMESEVSPA